MKVTELSEDQLEELRRNYFYDEEIEHKYDCIDDVPNEVLFKHYADIDFVNDDFGCTADFI